MWGSGSPRRGIAELAAPAAAPAAAETPAAPSGVGIDPPPLLRCCGYAPLALVSGLDRECKGVKVQGEGFAGSHRDYLQY